VGLGAVAANRAHNADMGLSATIGNLEEAMLALLGPSDKVT
jgi:hypothetical protein